MRPIKFAVARKIERGNPASTWFVEGKRSGGAALYGYDRVGSDFLKLRCTPRFSLPAAGAFFTMGSCFARGLENVLVGSGFDVRSVSREFDRFNHNGIGTPLGVTNRYNTGSILNEFRWALDPASPFPEEAIVDVDDGLSVDPHMNPTLKLADRATTLERRNIYTGVTRELANADVIIITLGLVEAWYDTQLGLVANVTPDPRVVRKEPDRFVFKRLTYVENMENLEAIHSLLARFGKPGHKIVVTVSPVPLMTTFTNEDIIVANSYSKTTLRAAATDFVESHDNVDYFPSYEIVTNSDPAVAWLPDRRHVRHDLASQIMIFFIRRWISGVQSRELAAVDMGAAY